MSDFDSNEHHGHPHIVFFNSEQQRAVTERHEAEMTEFRISIKRMMDNMAPDDMLTFYQFLNSLRGDPATTSYFAGQAAAILTYVHKMCTTCESFQHETMQHVAATAVAGVEEEFTNTFGEGDSEAKRLTETPDYQLGHDDLCRKYNVDYLADANQGAGAYRCATCKVEYPSLAHRRNTGLACPSCEAPKQLGIADGSADA